MTQFFHTDELGTGQSSGCWISTPYHSDEASKEGAVLEQQRKVQTIPATLTRFSATPISAQKKRRVAGYARVSTDHDDQFTSYEAQIDYYTNYIKGRDDWEFVSVYTDEGITGTSTKRREGFKRMIADTLDGRIDLIVTKSVSRFARNTVDSLTTIRQLKENGIEVYFEKENIWTFDGKGEVLLTIMSSLAQEESRSISENCTWGQRKRFADGKVTVPFKRFLGYDRGEDGNLVINPEQAEVVKRIYGMFLKGMTPHSIAKALTDKGIPTPAGKRQWGQTTIKSILSNEKYKGDALLQKTFCEDFLTKKMKTNQGEVPQYYVENNHEAIIDPETFEMVQRELARRTKGKNRHSGVHLLSGRIKCGDCGGWYGSKVWHSPEKCKRTVWQCNQKYKNEVRCTTPYLDEASVKERFTVAVNQLLAGRDAAIVAYEQGMALTLDTTALEAQQQELLSEMEVLNGMIQQMIRQNATVAQDQTEYKQRFDSLSQKFKDTEVKKDAVAQQISDILDRRGTMEDFLRILKQQDGEVTAFSEKLWCGLLDFATSYADGRLTFTFKNGSTFEG
ncbi:MAG: recombinase family protein [Oscillospiraceae bacterium]|nr:recombinase family protein [Oscillospiraceae bacterium]